MRQRIESLEQFRALQADYMAARDAEKRKILVCCGTGCVAGGNLNVYHELKKRMDELGIPCEVSLTEHHADAIGLKKSGCHGFCEMGPLVRIEPKVLNRIAAVTREEKHPETGEQSHHEFEAVITERTRLVAMTAASNLIGTRPPVRQVADLVRITVGDLGEIGDVEQVQPVRRHGH